MASQHIPTSAKSNNNTSLRRRVINQMIMRWQYLCPKLDRATQIPAAQRGGIGRVGRCPPHILAAGMQRHADLCGCLIAW